MSESSADTSRAVTVSESRYKAQVVLKRSVIALVYVVALVVALVVAVLYGIIVVPAKRAKRRFAGKSEDEALTNDWWGLNDSDDAEARDKKRPKQVNMRKGVDRRTCYITTRDGVKLATDVWIPTEALEKKGSLPVIFHQARYYRSATLRWPFNLIINGGKPINFINDPFFKSFLSHRMILVSVDVRGTGASFGTHPGPWSTQEQEDSVEVLDWIDRQDWSNGKVGLWGISYEATSAFFTSLKMHPTVVCCCPMFSFWDVYDDIAHPGGVVMKHFSVSWQGFNDSLDSGWVQSTGWMARIFLEGVSPVKGEDPWGYQANLAIREHENNWSVLRDDHIRYKDDISHTGRTVISACANRAVQELLARHGYTKPFPLPATPIKGQEALSGAPEGTLGVSAAKDEPFGGDGVLEDKLPYYLHVSGWLDASANSAVMGFMSLPCRGSELLVGPWNHGGHQHVRPHHVTSRSRFDFQTEVSGFLVRHLNPPSGKKLTAEDSTTLMDSPPQTSDGDKPSPALTMPPSPTSVIGRNSSAESVDGSAIDHVAGVIMPAKAPKAPTPHAPATLPKVMESVAEEHASPLLSGLEDEAGETADGEEIAVKRQDSGALWKKPRPRVRFYTFQEERWHEASTFPSVSSNKTDVVLSLGKSQQPQPQHRWSLSSPYVTVDSRTAGAIAKGAMRLGGRARASLGRITVANQGSSSPFSETSDTSQGRSGGVPAVRRSKSDIMTCSNSSIAEGNDAGQDEEGKEARKDVDLKSKMSASATASREWESGMIDGHVADVDDDMHEDSEGLVVPLVPSPVAAGGTAGGDESCVESDGSGVGITRRLSSRLSKRWPAFRKPTLVLSQEPDHQEETHELLVDVENDRDGEGVSRWAAMTEFLSLISYQMDGMRSNHMRFTSPPLKQDMEVTGYPVVTLWLSVTDDLPNLDVFAYLQAVRPRTGLSIYVTEGCFRAEHRKEVERAAPIEARGLPGVPIHSHLREDAEPMDKGRPVELKFKLMPTSFRFLKGQRVRLSIGGADARHFRPIPAPELADGSNSPSPKVKVEGAKPSHDTENTEGAEDNDRDTRRVLRVHTGGTFASGVSLPVPRHVVKESDDGHACDDGNGQQDTQNATTPRPESFARKVWARRPRSMSSPRVLSTISTWNSEVTPGPLTQGRWAGSSPGQSEGSSPTCRVNSGKLDSNIFYD